MNTPRSLAHPLILLAAGESSRMGSPKGLLPYFGKPWLIEQLSRFRRAGGQRACVVLGDAWSTYQEELGFAPQPPAPAKVEGLDVLYTRNKQPKWGTFSSLQAGFAALGTTLPGAFLLPVDVPAPASVWPLLEPKSAAVDAVVPTFNSAGGHPVWLSGRFIDRLRQIPNSRPEARLDLQIQNLSKSACQRVAVSTQAVLRNLNDTRSWQDYVAEQTQ